MSLFLFLVVAIGILAVDKEDLSTVVDVIFAVTFIVFVSSVGIVIFTEI